MAILIEPPSSIESGSFIPKLIDSNNFNYSHSHQSGRFSKIGDVIVFDSKVVVNMAGAGTGILQLKTNLPYIFTREQFLEGYFHGIASNFDPIFLAVVGTNLINIMYLAGTATLTSSQLRGSNFRTTGNFTAYCSGQIFV